MNEHYIEFYVNKLNYIKSYDEADVSFIPPLIRRKTDKLDKCVLSVLNNCYSDEIQSVFFMSKEGQVERLEQMISQYVPDNEISPMTFSGSVHNYSTALFLMLFKKALPYNALSADINPLSIGLLTSVISKWENILYCYSDLVDNDYISLALNISKKPLAKSQRYRISLKQNIEAKDNFNEYIDLFEGRKLNVINSMYVLERIVDEN